MVRIGGGWWRVEGREMEEAEEKSVRKLPQLGDN